MLRVALTGGIATGKTHVLRRLNALGVPTIDSDALVHDALAAGTPVAGEIAARFGPSVVAADGSIDRRRLGGLVFRDEAARRDLERIVHPRVYAAIEDWFGRLEPSSEPPGRPSIAVADIPLLFETGRQGAFDRVVVAACRPETQVKRVMARDGLSEADARARVAVQLPIADKIRRAHFVIHTDGDPADTDRQVDELLAALRGGSP